MKQAQLFIVVIVAALIGALVGHTPAVAQGKQAPVGQRPPAPARAAVTRPPAIDPAALELIKAMSDKLAAAKSVAFVATGAFDVPARNGQPLFYTTRSEVLLVRPNKLRVIVPGDGPPSEFYFDGKTIAVFHPYTDLVATTEAPGTLDAALDAIYAKAGIYFPFVDFLVEDPYATLTGKLKSAFVIGKSKVVGGTTTDVVSLSNAHVHLQLWIGEDDKLPKLLWVTAADQVKQPRHMVEFSDWRLDDDADASASFTPKTTDSTKQIRFARPESHPQAKH